MPYGQFNMGWCCDLYPEWRSYLGTDVPGFGGAMRRVCVTNTFPPVSTLSDIPWLPVRPGSSNDHPTNEPHFARGYGSIYMLLSYGPSFSPRFERWFADSCQRIWSVPISSAGAFRTEPSGSAAQQNSIWGQFFSVGSHGFIYALPDYFSGANGFAWYAKEDGEALYEFKGLSVASNGRLKISPNSTHCVTQHKSGSSVVVRVGQLLIEDLGTSYRASCDGSVAEHIISNSELSQVMTVQEGAEGECYYSIWTSTARIFHTPVYSDVLTNQSSFSTNIDGFTVTSANNNSQFPVVTLRINNHGPFLNWDITAEGAGMQARLGGQYWGELGQGQWEYIATGSGVNRLTIVPVQDSWHIGSIEAEDFYEGFDEYEGDGPGKYRLAHDGASLKKNLGGCVTVTGWPGNVLKSDGISA